MFSSTGAARQTPSSYLGIRARVERAWTGQRGKLLAPFALSVQLEAAETRHPLGLWPLLLVHRFRHFRGVAETGGGDGRVRRRRWWVRISVGGTERRYHRRDFSVSGSNNVSGCRLYGVRPGTGECPVGSSDDARSPGATPVRTYISILTNHYYMPGEPRWAESTTNAHVAYLDQVYQQFTGARAL